MQMAHKSKAFVRLMSGLMIFIVLQKTPGNC